MSLKILFMGSPEFSLPSLSSLSTHFDVVGVVTQPDRRAGRGKSLTPPPVKVLAEKLGIEVFQPETLRTTEAFDKLQSWKPDLIVVTAFGQILKPNVLQLPEFGCINVHASLLPRWRGAAPINAAILAGDGETGVTIMKMDAGLDTGPILTMKAIPIQPEDNAGTLSEKLAKLGGDLLVETLPGYLSGEITPRPQPEDGATYAPMLSKQDGALDFSEPAEQLARKVRAYDPWPGTFMHWEGNLLKVHQAQSASGNFSQSGSRLIHDGLPAVATPDGALLLEKVQPAGKKPMEGSIFLNGARDWIQKGGR